MLIAADSWLLLQIQ